jgi:hypothetical protein
MTFGSYRKYNFPSLPRQLLSAIKGKMVNTLSESTHRVFIRKETVNNRADLVFFFFCNFSKGGLGLTLHVRLLKAQLSYSWASKSFYTVRPKQ